jgi:hypothetical protein
MFKKILWIFLLILILGSLIGFSYYIIKYNDLFSVGSSASNCEDNECCKNLGYDYFDISTKDCFSAGTLESNLAGGGSNG